MMVAGRHRIKNHMTMEYVFSGIRLLSGMLVPVDWRITANIVVVDQSKDDIEVAEYKATVVYQKLLFWLETNLPGTIMVDVASENDLYLANLSANLMMYCPDLPYDDTIIEMLHSKLTQLAGNNLIIGEMTIKASDMSVQYTFDCVKGDYNLPLTTEEYYIEGSCRDEKPWWARDDGFCFEFVKSDDPEIPDCFEAIVDPLDEFDEAFRESAARHANEDKEPARIVQVEKWKPKLI